MFRSLYSKMALSMLAVFCAMGAILVYALGIMFDPHQIGTIATKILISCLLFAFLAGLMVFSMFTRPLQQLADSVDSFRSSNFLMPVKISISDPGGDEIDRLGYSFEQMQQRIIDQVQRLQNVDTQRRELLANVSHDLRTPLASMRGYLETLLLKQGMISDEEQRNYLEIATKQGERLGKLIADLFEFSKLDANEVTLTLEVFSISELLQDIAQKFQLSAAQRQVRIDTHFTPSMLLVNADIGLIERVLENLIENALRHCPSGTAVRLSAERSDDFVLVKVADTGSGIAPKDLGKIFDRFYQGDRNYGQRGGAGLGLAITRQILLLHGADIQVESTLGQGTTFSFRLRAT